MRKLQQDQRMDFLLAQADNESLQTWIKYLKEANDKTDQELESRNNGHRGSLKISSGGAYQHVLEGSCKVLGRGMKAASGRANTLQIGMNALQAEKSVLQVKKNDGRGLDSNMSVERA